MCVVHTYVCEPHKYIPIKLCTVCVCEVSVCCGKVEMEGESETKNTGVVPLKSVRNDVKFA